MEDFTCTNLPEAKKIMIILQEGLSDFLHIPRGCRNKNALNYSKRLL